MSNNNTPGWSIGLTLASWFAVASLLQSHSRQQGRDRVCRELLHHADAVYVGMPDVCEVPHGE